MKYCMKCGNPLPDDAKFCVKCGTPQEDVDNEEQVMPEDPQAAPQPQAVPATLSPGERFKQYCEKDEGFKVVTKAVKMVNLGGLVNVLFLAVSLIALLVPIGVFTDYMKDGIPAVFSSVTLRTFYNAAGGKLSPNSGLNGLSGMIMIIFTFPFTVLLVMTAIFGRTKGWMLKIYETKGLQQLIKELKSSTVFLIGTIFSLAPLGIMITNYVTAKNLDYSEHPASNYMFGRIDPLPGGFIAALIICIILILIMLGVGILFRVLFNKKVSKYITAEQK